MKSSTVVIVLVRLALMFFRPAAAQINGLLVYGSVPGLAPSDQYRFRVRVVGSGEQGWQAAFASIIRCKNTPKGKDAYFPELAGWSNTYINFEMSRPVEVEICRINSQPIRTAAADPYQLHLHLARKRRRHQPFRQRSGGRLLPSDTGRFPLCQRARNSQNGSLERRQRIVVRALSATATHRPHADR